MKPTHLSDRWTGSAEARRTHLSDKQTGLVRARLEAFESVEEPKERVAGERDGWGGRTRQPTGGPTPSRGTKKEEPLERLAALEGLLKHYSEISRS